MKLIIISLLFAVSFCFEVFSQAPALIWEETLNFTWHGRNILTPGTEENDNVNTWHTSKTALLTEAYRVGGRPNFAVARLGMVYSREGSENLYVKYLEIPFLFASGWAEPVGVRDIPILALQGTFRQRIQDATNYPPDRLRFLGRTISSSLHFEDNDYGNDIVYCSYLMNTFSGYGRGTYLYPLGLPAPQNRFREKTDFLNRLFENGHGGMPRIRSENDRRTRFLSRFYDTEQTIYLTIQKAFNWGIVPENHAIRGFFNDANPDRVPANATIHLCKIDIASYFDMCLDCGDTGYALMRTKRGLSDSISIALREWGILTTPDFTCCIEISSRNRSQIPFSALDGLVWDSREGHRLFNNGAVPFEASAVFPSVAQIGF